MANAIDEGRTLQFREMMEKFDAIASRYKGVRGELLEKVKNELLTLEPGAKSTVTVTPAKATPPGPAVMGETKPAANKASASTVGDALPSCRRCGRNMRASADGTLVCQNGHIRMLAS